MNIAIIGAGIAGLACARKLKSSGLTPVLFEKSRGPGGRVSTRRVGPYTFDSGAQSIASPPNQLTEAMLGDLSTEKLYKIESPIYTHNSLHVSPGDSRKNSAPRYTYLGGINQLPKLLAEGIEIRTQVTIDELTKQGDRYSVNGELFEAVVLTMPVPQASLLLWSLGERRSTGPSRYRSCLSILLGYDVPAPTHTYHALICTDGGHPLQWLGLESVKCPDRAPEGQTALIAQMSAPFSLTAWNWSQERLVETVCTYISRLYGSEWLKPVASDVMKWKYSQPEMVVSFDSVNRPGSKLILAGDGLAGGRIEHAFASGVKAAEALLA